MIDQGVIGCLICRGAGAGFGGNIWA